jgi:hypothetical protein
MLDEMRYRMNCFVLLYIALPSSTAATIVAKLSSARTISDHDIKEKYFQSNEYSHDDWFGQTGHMI